MRYLLLDILPYLEDVFSHRLRLVPGPQRIGPEKPPDGFRWFEQLPGTFPHAKNVATVPLPIDDTNILGRDSRMGQRVRAVRRKNHLAALVARDAAGVHQGRQGRRVDGGFDLVDEDQHWYRLLAQGHEDAKTVESAIRHFRADETAPPFA